MQVPDVEFPFKNLYDDQGDKLNVIAISAPFRETKHELLYKSYVGSNLNILGLSSYSEFPYQINNPFDDFFHKEREHDYIHMTSAWIHCFRDPGLTLRRSGLPLLFLTEADLKNTEHYKPDPSIPKKYDFIYVCLDDNDSCTPGWNSYIRSWDLAKSCIEIMCSRFQMKGLIVGRTNCEFTQHMKTCNVETTPFLPFHEFQKEMQKCKFLFAPNISDASPRVITEALLYNMPVLVNKNIVGGWHNVIPGITGEFFTNQDDIEISLQKLVSNKYTPRDWFIRNRGLNVSGKILAGFLKTTYPNINRPNMLHAYI